MSLPRRLAAPPLALAALAALAACPAPVTPPATSPSSTVVSGSPRPTATPFQFGNPAFPDARPDVAKPTTLPSATPTPTPAATPTPVPTPTPTPEATLPPPPGVAAYDLPTLGVVATTMHGGGGSGTVEGSQTNFKLNAPEGLVFGDGGVIYVADTGNHAIRRSRIETGPSGSTRIGENLLGPVGADKAGFFDGTDTTSRFNTPRGLALGPNETLFIVDAGNHCIRKAFLNPPNDPTPRVTTIAGARVPGYKDAVLTESQFNDPTGIAVDKDGNAYVTDTGNHCIRKITPAGVVTTLAGTGGVAGHKDGAGRAAQFSSPRGIVVDNATDLYVCDTGNDCIRKISSSGQVTTLAGSPDNGGFANGEGAAARFDGPTGLGLAPDGTLFVSDFNNNRIRKVTKAGVVTTFAGTGAVGALDGPGAYATFNAPQGVVVQPDSGDLFVAESGNHTVRNLLLEHFVSTELGSTTPGAVDDRLGFATFRAPMGIARDKAGNFYLADAGNHVVRKADKDGRVTTLAGLAGAVGDDDGTGTAARFETPRSVAVDPAGNVYVADEGNHRIRKITPGGKVTTIAGGDGPGKKDGKGSAALFNVPRGIAIAPDGNLYVADFGNHLIRKVTPAGEVTTYAGDGTAGFRDGETALAARFTKPTGVATDAQGRVYVADFGNNAIRLISVVDGVVKVGTFAGASAFPGYVDGTGGSAQFNDPWGLTVDVLGRVYVADYGNCLIRRITPDGEVSTYAGFVDATTKEPQAGYFDGRASLARFAAPAGVVVDELGYVFVVDSENNCIRRIH